ncbi:SusE domain-containing protein [Aquimarina sp. M1]
MKTKMNIKHFWFLLLSLLFITISCEEEESNVSEISSWELSEATITYPEDNFSFDLDKDNREDVLRFEWEKPASERDYLITYTWLLDTENGDFSDPLLKVASPDDGTQTFAEVPYFMLDQALSNIGIEPNELVNVKWGVEATSISNTSLSAHIISLRRFDTQGPPQQLYLSGAASEAGTDISNALLMNKIKRADGTDTNTFQIYSALESGLTYNFYSDNSSQASVYTSDGGTIINGNTGIIAPESGVYRITVDFDTETLSLFKIDKWSIVGNVIPNGWGGDVPLSYAGNGVWQAHIELMDADAGDPNKRFIFRANDDWGQVFKRISGTSSELAFEGTGDDLGYNLEDVPVDQLGRFIITLTLNGNGYRYAIEEDPDPDTGSPDQLFLFADGVLEAEFIKNGDIFIYEFLDVDITINYTIVEHQDGSGNAYSFLGNIGETSEESDKVSGSGTFEVGNTAVTFAKNQAFRIQLDFGSDTLSWDYYNFKLFHWDVWDTRQEIVMTYVGDYSWEITADLTAGHNSKFITPWDFQYGGTVPDALNGDLINNGGEDINNIIEDGTYSVTMNLSSDFSTGTYSFSPQ